MLAPHCLARAIFVVVVSFCVLWRCAVGERFPAGSGLKIRGQFQELVTPVSLSNHSALSVSYCINISEASPSGTIAAHAYGANFEWSWDHQPQRLVLTSQRSVWCFPYHSRLGKPTKVAASLEVGQAPSVFIDNIAATGDETCTHLRPSEVFLDGVLRLGTGYQGGDYVLSSFEMQSRARSDFSEISPQDSECFYTLADPPGSPFARDESPHGRNLTVDFRLPSTSGFTTDPVHGGWSAWGLCGNGACNTNGTQTRTCTNPSPYGFGADCQGESSRLCSNVPCAAWSGWSDCSVSCGNGTQTRICQHKDEAHNQTCPGPSQRFCSTQGCPVDGGWSGWDGCFPNSTYYFQNRSCTNPPPSNGGQDCLGNATRLCHSQWSGWGVCSELCGSGMQSRECEVPLTLWNGTRMCQGLTSRSCNTFPCQDGAWSGWFGCFPNSTHYFQNRSCTNPPPSPGGKDCSGSATRLCQSQWSGWGVCTEPCGGGLESRVCEVPLTLWNGTRMCEGQSSRSCNSFSCPIWSGWSVCSKSCDAGIQTRSCRNENEDNRHLCRDPTLNTQHCNTPACPGYTEWLCSPDNIQRRACIKNSEVDCVGELSRACRSVWSGCDEQCGVGQQTRTCYDGVTNRNVTCEGDTVRSCNTDPCPYFDPWSDCTKSCGGGNMTRVCHNAAYPQLPCEPDQDGDAREAKECNTQDCPVPVAAGSSSSGLAPWKVALIVLGGVLGVLIIAALAYHFWKRCSQNAAKKGFVPVNSTTGGENVAGNT